MDEVARSKGKRTAWYAMAYMSGIGLGSVIDIPMALIYACMVVVVAMHLQQRWFMWWVCGWMCVGLWHITWIQTHETSALDHRLGKQDITAIVAREVEHRLDTQRVVVKDEYTQEHILMWLPTYPRVHVGDTVHAECTLSRPEAFDAFAYDEYLKTQDIFYQCDWAREVDVVAEGTPTPKRTLFLFKKQLNENMQSMLPEPHASFLAGILYGDRGGLSKRLQDAFAITGTSHILAISGYNITIITVTLISLMAGILVPRKRAVWLVLIGIGIFAVFVGSQASIIRAAIMGMVPLLARMIGRLTKPVYVLIHAALIMVMFNPRILVYDPGFQLSVAATAGLILLTPRLLKKTEWVPEIMNVKDAALATLAATIATLPLMLYHFGRLSVVSIPVNMLILPLMPLVMATGMVMLLALAIHPLVAVFVGSVPYVLISWVLWIIDVAAGIPLAAVSIPFNGFWLAVSYGGMLYMVLHSKKYIPPESVVCDEEVWIIREYDT